MSVRVFGCLFPPMEFPEEELNPAGFLSCKSLCRWLIVAGAWQWLLPSFLGTGNRRVSIVFLLSLPQDQALCSRRLPRYGSIRYQGKKITRFSVGASSKRAFLSEIFPLQICEFHRQYDIKHTRKPNSISFSQVSSQVSSQFSSQVFFSGLLSGFLLEFSSQAFSSIFF